MKKITILLLSILMTFAFMPWSAYAEESVAEESELEITELDEESAIEAKTASDFKLSTSELTMGVDSIIEIKTLPETGVYWKTTNSDIVVLEDAFGNPFPSEGTSSYVSIKSKKAGKATIIAEAYDGRTAMCIVTVKSPYIELSEYEVAFSFIGKPGAPPGTYNNKSENTVVVTSGRAATVKSSDEDVARASIEKNAYLDRLDRIKITGKKAGSADITVVSKDGATAVIKVNVSYEYSFNRDSLSIDCTYDDYWLDDYNVKGNIILVSPYNDLEPDEYDICLDGYYSNVIAESDDTSVVKLRNDAAYSWSIIPQKPGKANIIIRDDFYGIYKKIPVTVSNKYRPPHNNHEIRSTSKMPTCKEAGMKKHFECTVCHKMFKDAAGTKELTKKEIKKLTIKKKKHNFKEKSGEYLKSAATCTKPAYYYYTCKMCHQKGKKTYKVGKALGHDYIQGSIKKATGKKDGKIASKCSRCGKTNNGVKIPKASKIVLLNKKSVKYVGAGGEKELIKVVVKKSKYPLNENEYDVSYSEPVYKGKKSKGTVTIKFKPECKYYSGTIKLTYKITKAPKK